MVMTANGYDFHELLSALQKCIRRNMEYEAVSFAFEVESFNKTALWNRLKVIASEDIGCANPLMAVLIETLHKQYEHEGLDGSRLLFVVNAVVCLCRSPKSRIVDDLLNVVLLENKRIPIPDFALDMHTLRGRNLGRGYEHFFSEGSKLENEAFPNPYRDKAKELLLKHGKPSQ